MYEPQEDSYLLRDAVANFLATTSNKNSQVKIALDMGTGSGIQGIEIAGKVEIIILSDINVDVIHTLAEKIAQKQKEIDDKEKNKNENLKQNETEKIKSIFKIFKGDLFEYIPKEFQNKIDLIIFNPPYLPREEYEIDDIELTSGESGIETTKKFLSDAKKFLSQNGNIFFVASSLAQINELENFMQNENYEFLIDRKQHISFEDIIIYRAWQK